MQVRSRAEELKKSLDQIAVALELYADKVQWQVDLPAFISWILVNATAHAVNKPVIHGI